MSSDSENYRLVIGCTVFPSKDHSFVIVAIGQPRFKQNRELHRPTVQMIKNWDVKHGQDTDKGFASFLWSQLC